MCRQLEIRIHIQARPFIEQPTASKANPDVAINVKMICLRPGSAP